MGNSGCWAHGSVAQPSPLTAGSAAKAAASARRTAANVQRALDDLAANHATALLQIETNRSAALFRVASAVSSFAGLESEVTIAFDNFAESVETCAAAKRVELESLAVKVDAALEESISVAAALEQAARGTTVMVPALLERCRAVINGVAAVEACPTEDVAFLAVSYPHPLSVALDAIATAVAGAAAADAGPLALLAVRAAAQGVLGELVQVPGHVYSATCSHVRSSEDRGVWAAAAAGDVVALKAALGSGGSTEELGELGYSTMTAIAAAAANGHVDAVRTLVGAGADVMCTQDEPALTAAATHGQAAVIAYLLTVPRVDPAFSEPEMGYTALHRAAVYNHAGAAALLVADPRVDPNAREHTHGGFTPLHFAASDGHVAVIRALLANPRVDPNAILSVECFCDPCRSRNGRAEFTPLALAKRRPHASALAVLLWDGRVRNVPAAHRIRGNPQDEWRERFRCELLDDTDELVGDNAMGGTGAVPERGDAGDGSQADNGIEAFGTSGDAARAVQAEVPRDRLEAGGESR